MHYPIATILIGATAATLAALAVATFFARAGRLTVAAGRRLGCIDGLRGYLALSVLVHHFIIWLQVDRLGGGWAPPSVNFFNQMGAGAVALFFMIAGFVFYPRVLDGLRAVSWPALYLNRLFRIVPMVVVSVAIVTAIVAWRTGRGLDADYPRAAAAWITTWGEPPLLGYPDSGRLNAYVLWSLWYEWLFYLFVLPACALAIDLVRGRLPSWTVPATLLAGSVVAQVLNAPFALLRYLPLFAIGMLAFEVQRREPVARLLRRPAASVVAGAALLVGMTATPFPYTFAMPHFAVFFAAIACGNSLGGLLGTRGARALGECSYGIYLLHGIGLGVVFVEAGAWTRGIPTAVLPLLLPGVAVAMTAFAWLTFRLVERPAIRLGHRLGRPVRREDRPRFAESTPPTAAE